MVLEEGKRETEGHKNHFWGGIEVKIKEELPLRTGELAMAMVDGAGAGAGAKRKTGEK
jgi:hypothetical protein